jgi:protein TonB
MQVTAYLRNRPIFPAAAASIVFSFALFGLLYSLISVGHRMLEKQEPLQTIDFVRLKHDTDVETTARRKPPPPPTQPPPPAKMRVATEAVQQDGLSGFSVPNLNLTAAVGGGPIAGKAGGPGGGMFDGDLMPLQRIPPQYPRDAARAGITGWVQLEVVVNADGSVRTARVLDAKPKGMFEASAIQAVLRWKFKPKVVDGKPVEQKGSQKIDFSINQAASAG